MADTLCIDDDVVFLTHLTALNNVIDQLLLIIVILLRDQNILGSVGNTTPQCKPAGSTSHNLDDTASLMGSRCITNLVNCFHSCINSGIKTDGVLCTCNVKVDGSWNSDCVDSKVSKLLRSSKGTVSTDYNKSVNTVLAADLCTTLLSFRCAELGTSCSVKNCTTTLDGVGYISCCHIDDLFV